MVSQKAERYSCLENLRFYGSWYPRKLRSIPVSKTSDSMVSRKGTDRIFYRLCDGVTRKKHWLASGSVKPGRSISPDDPSRSALTMQPLLRFSSAQQTQERLPSSPTQESLPSSPTQVRVCQVRTLAGKTTDFKQQRVGQQGKIYPLTYNRIIFFVSVEGGYLLCDELSVEVGYLLRNKLSVEDGYLLRDELSVEDGYLLRNELSVEDGYLLRDELSVEDG
ncbi:Smr domain protein [Elysia marginata]|uniref:Smr domain protein n=1 Tax=Elysia marginata TaxID=1093978 RepID=A0AAV4JRS2_9GAST|nr:Smr domain protein [Elysia marginata]